jgi:hypothetical protein
MVGTYSILAESVGFGNIMEIRKDLIHTLSKEETLYSK